MTFSIRSALMLSSLAGAALGSLPAQAGSVPGRQYFTIGAGGGMLANGQPCPDLPCNGTDVCTCVQASGDLAFSTTSKMFPSGSFTLELSADKNTIMPNGVGGHCYGAGGYMVITTPRGTLTILISGPACRLGTGDGDPDTVPYGISIAASIVSGTGYYTNPIGTGTLAASFNPMTKSVALDLIGYGNLVN